jgi:hypothetical protein
MHVVNCFFRNTLWHSSYWCKMNFTNIHQHDKWNTIVNYKHKLARLLSRQLLKKNEPPKMASSGWFILAYSLLPFCSHFTAKALHMYIDILMSLFKNFRPGLPDVIFSIRNLNLGKFWRVLEWKMFIYSVVIWNILLPFGVHISWQFGKFCCHLVFILLPVLVCFTKKIWQPCFLHNCKISLPYYWT